MDSRVRSRSLNFLLASDLGQVYSCFFNFLICRKDILVSPSNNKLGKIGFRTLTNWILERERVLSLEIVVLYFSRKEVESGGKLPVTRG